MPVAIELDPYFSPDRLEEGYYRYKASKTDRYDPCKVTIPMGADGTSWQVFERGLQERVDTISRVVLDGTYRFYPFREVEVPKPAGGVRILSVASVRDAIVQRQLYEVLYWGAEDMFAMPILDKVSFAYRRGKSAPYAAQRMWKSIQGGYRYAFEADIQKFFDTLDHERLMHLIDGWVGRDTVVRTLLWRYVRTDRVPYDSYPHDREEREKYFTTKKPKRVRRLRGVPQGGVLSGLLSNLYLHEFDRWVVEELRDRVDLRYYRYADDFVMLTRDRETAQALRAPVSKKLKELKLKIHPSPEKTGTRDLAKDGLEFIGFRFTDKHVQVRPKNIERFRDRFLESLQNEPTLKHRSNHWTVRFHLAIRWCVNPKITGPIPERCERCGLAKAPRRSWVAFFAPAITDVKQLKQLDRWVRRRVYKYFRDRYRVRVPRKYLRGHEMKSLVGEYYRLKREYAQLCACDQCAEEETEQGIEDLPEMEGWEEL